MKQYEARWPESFHKPISKPVVMMSVSKKRLNIDGVAVFDTLLIYSRVLCLQKVRNIDMKEVLHHEPAGVPPLMFDESSDMSIAASKSTLKSILQPKLAHFRSQPPDAIILDGCAILWVKGWPAHGTTQSYVENFVNYVTLQITDTYQIFDRHYQHSTKETTCISRAGKDLSRLLPPI